MTIRTVNFQNYYVKYCKVNIIILISCNREWYHIITIKQMHYTVVLLFWKNMVMQEWRPLSLSCVSISNLRASHAWLSTALTVTLDKEQMLTLMPTLNRTSTKGWWESVNNEKTRNVSIGHRWPPHSWWTQNWLLKCDHNPEYRGIKISRSTS